MAGAYARVALERVPGHQQSLQMRKNQPRQSWRVNEDEANLANPVTEHSFKQQVPEIYCLATVCLTAPQ